MDLAALFMAQEHSARWKAEYENASARLELARIAERCAYLISQHEPVASLGIDRECLRHIFRYLRNGNLAALSQRQEG